LKLAVGHRLVSKNLSSMQRSHQKHNRAARRNIFRALCAIVRKGDEGREGKSLCEYAASTPLLRGSATAYTYSICLYSKPLRTCPCAPNTLARVPQTTNKQTNKQTNKKKKGSGGKGKRKKRTRHTFLAAMREFLPLYVHQKRSDRDFLVGKRQETWMGTCTKYCSLQPCYKVSLRCPGVIPRTGRLQARPQIRVSPPQGSQERKRKQKKKQEKKSQATKSSPWDISPSSLTSN
jgi:hypothetical protein